MAPLSLAVIVVAVALVGAGCSSAKQSTAAVSATQTPKPSPSLQPAKVTSDIGLLASLRRAIASATPSMSAKALDAHICEVTGAPSTLIVVPYDPTAYAESERMAKTAVAWSGIDGAFATGFQGLLHDTGGRAYHARKLILGGFPRYYLAGLPLNVDGRDGYVLVGAPVQ